MPIKVNSGIFAYSRLESIRVDVGQRSKSPQQRLDHARSGDAKGLQRRKKSGMERNAPRKSESGCRDSKLEVSGNKELDCRITASVAGTPPDQSPSGFSIPITKRTNDANPIGTYSNLETGAGAMERIAVLTKASGLGEALHKTMLPVRMRSFQCLMNS